MDRWKWSLEAVRLGYGPMGANPRVGDVISWFKSGAVGSSWLSISFDPIIFFSYSFVVEYCCIAPKEVLEMQGAGSYVSGFVESKDKEGTWVLGVLVLFPTVILEVS